MTKSKHHIFTGLSEGYQLLSESGAYTLASSAYVIQDYKKGELLISQGDVVNYVYSLREGIACGGHPSDNAPQITTTFFLQKDLVVASFLFNRVSPIELMSVGPSTVVKWPVEAFMAALRESPDFSVWLLGYMSARLARQHFLRVRTELASIEMLLAHFLWLVSELGPEGTRIVTIKIPQETLASYFSITRSVLNKHRRHLEISGYITNTPQGTVLSPDIAILFSAHSDIPAPWEALSPKAQHTTPTSSSGNLGRILAD
ncbi:MAG: Crp/Fnr family transcriptional regulator [Agitococcus sp.]|nr:Crp/Fnr family transcriptional regulator [Agitococcus sp.]